MTWLRAKERARRYAGVILVMFVGALFLASQGSNLHSLVASTGFLGQTAAATMFITARDETLKIGHTGMLDIQVTSDVPINAIGATLSFDPEALEIVGISKENSFLDLWTEETVIRENAGEIHFSGGTYRKNGLQGTANLLTLSVRPKRAGETSVSFKETQVLASDGKGTIIENERQPLTLSVQPNVITPKTVVPLGGDFTGDERVTIADLFFSLLMIKPLSSYNPMYDIDRNGTVSLKDISIFFRQMER